jgi:LEA14-like dessication related protein
MSPGITLGIRLLAILLLLPFSFLVINGCASLELLEKKPEVNFKDIKLGGFDFQSIDLDLTYEIKNPYSFEFVLNSLTYVLKIEGAQILNSNLSLDKVIPPNQSSPLNMRLHLTYAQLGKVFNDLLVKKEINAHVDGHVKLGFPNDLSLPSGLDIPFAYDKHLALVLQ